MPITTDYPERGEVNLLILSSSFPESPQSYAGIFILEQVRRLALTPFRPIVLAPHFYGSKLQEWWPPVLVYRFPYFFPTRFEQLAYGSGMFYNLRKNPLALFTLPAFLLSEIIFTTYHKRKSRVSIIHTHWLLPQGLVGSLIYRCLKVPHVATIHGSDLNIIKKYPVLHPLCRFIVQNADIITVNSTFMQRQLLDVIPGCAGKSRVIPIGVDPGRLQARARDDIRTSFSSYRVILNVGRLIDWKGTIYLVEAMSAVLKKCPDALLVIIGTGPEEGDLKQRVRELGLEGNVRFMGFVSTEDLPSYYHMASVFVLPSITIEGQTEGLGVVLLEAMAAGCPVIGSNTGGIPDIIVDGESGFLVPERDVAALAEKIVRILSDEPLREKFRRNGLMRVRERFSWERISGQFIDMYQQVLNQKS